MRYVKIVIMLICCLAMCGCVDDTAQSNEKNVKTWYGASFVGADDKPLVLVDNSNATNPTYDQLLNFLYNDQTDQIQFDDSKFICGDYVEAVHNNAEAAGYTAGVVHVEFENPHDDYDGHLLNVFNTTDKGLIFIDCTGSTPGDPYDAAVRISVGEDYKPKELFTEYERANWGAVKSFEIFW